MTVPDISPLIYLLDDISALLGDLFLGGFGPAGESTSTHIKELSESCRNTGLAAAGDMLGDIYALIEARRHDGKNRNDEICGAMCELMDYVSICRERIDIDTAKNNLLTEDAENEEE